MRLVNGSARSWPVRWVWAVKGAPVIQGPSPFRSNRTWDNGYKPPQEYRYSAWAYPFYKSLWVPPALGEQNFTTDCPYDRGISKDMGKPHEVCLNPDVFVHGLKPNQVVVDPCCPPPVHNAVMSYEPKGAGMVVCIGTPTVFAASVHDPSTPVGRLPNADLWSSFDFWLLNYLAPGVVSAAAGDASAWLMASHWAPSISGVGAAATDYRSAAAQIALVNTLASVRILWCGYWRNYPDPPQELSEDVYDILIAWIRDGGILVIVSQFDQMGLTRADLNDTLVGLNCAQRFDPADDQGPWSDELTLKFRASTYGPGFGPPPYQQWTGGTTDPAVSFLSCQQVGVNSLRYYETITIGFYSPYWVTWLYPSYLVEVSITATVVGGVDAVDLGVQVLVGGGGFYFAGTIAGQTNTPRTVYTFRPAPHTIRTGTGSRGVLLGSFRDVAMQSFSIHAVTYVEEVCHPTAGCGSMALGQNLAAPMLVLEEGGSSACHSHSRRAQTVVGGLTTLWYEPKSAGKCTELYLALRASSVQGASHQQRGKAWLGMFCRSTQHIGYSQRSAGYLGLVADSVQHIGYSQHSLANMALLAHSVSGMGAVQRSVARLGLRVTSTYARGPAQHFAGYLGLRASSLQHKAYHQTSAGYLGMLADSVQATGAVQRSAGYLGMPADSVQTYADPSYLRDLFTGANGTNLTAHTMNVGGPWVATQGAILIQSNKAVPSTVPALYLANSGHTDVVAIATFSPGASATESSLVIRGSDATHYWEFRLKSSSATQIVYLANGGAPVAIATSTFSWGGSAIVVKFSFFGTRWRAFINGSQVLTGTSSTLSANTKCGLKSLQTTAPTFDNYVVLPSTF